MILEWRIPLQFLVTTHYHQMDFLTFKREATWLYGFTNSSLPACPCWNRFSNPYSLWDIYTASRPIWWNSCHFACLVETHLCLSPIPKLSLTLVPFTGLGSLRKPEKAILGVESEFVLQRVKDVALESETWFDSTFAT